MKELIDWLIQVEQMAEDFYRCCSDCLQGEPRLQEFLRHLADEEVEHRKLLQSALNCLSQLSHPLSPAIIADTVLRSRIERFFNERTGIADGASITREEVLKTLLDSEFSEWNDLFVYVMSHLRETGREFQQAASAMERHRKCCIRLLEQYPETRELALRLSGLLSIWENKILVVDDSESVRNLLSMVLRFSSQVFTATDGSEALDLCKKNYFDFIITDVEMPRMSGVDFFKEASKGEPDLAARILFFTSCLNEGEERFLREHGLRVIRKPGSLTEIMEISRRALS